jgi:predicted transcriptional regulator
MKKNSTKKVPAVVEQGRELNLDAIVEILDEASVNIMAVAIAIRHLKANEQKNAVVEQKINEMLARVAKHQGITLNEMLASAA